jgi:ribose 5-phosphate isomerase RpiB
LPADEIDISTAVKEIRAWLGVEFLNGRYLERLKMIEEIEKENMK